MPAFGSTRTPVYNAWAAKESQRSNGLSSLEDEDPILEKLIPLFPRRGITPGGDFQTQATVEKLQNEVALLSAELAALKQAVVSLKSSVSSIPGFVSPADSLKEYALITGASVTETHSSNFLGEKPCLVAKRQVLK